MTTSGDAHRPEARGRFARFIALVRVGDRRVVLGGAALAVAIGVIAAVLIIVESSDSPRHTPPSPHRPVANGPAETPVPTSATRSSQRARHQHPQRPFGCAKPPAATDSATPLQICIPAIRISASVMSLGLNRDHTVQVPPLSQVSKAGWYRYSAQPGAAGPTVILGHVDSARYGDGVFFRLSQLRRGDTIRVVRGDGAVATYRVDRVTEVSKKRFPTQAVYGRTQRPEIRLVTCGGRFDQSIGSYLDNIISYGSLISLRDQ